MVRLSTLLAAIAALAVAATLVAAAAASRAHVDAQPAAVPAVPLRPTVKLAPTPSRARIAAHPRHTAKRHPAPAVTHEVLLVRSGRQAALRSSPSGPEVAKIGDRTEFGSPSTLAVVTHRGGWVAVTTTNLPNGTLGWLREDSSDVQRASITQRIVVNLSRRSVTLEDGRRKVRTFTVAIGRPGSQTPTGTFAVTDKMAGGTYGAYYGCCILALSGHQPHTPPGWKGGDRLAIHGTDSPSTIGTPASAGCLRAADADLHVLMDQVPLGTPVVISG